MRITKWEKGKAGQHRAFYSSSASSLLTTVRCPAREEGFSASAVSMAKFARRAAARSSACSRLKPGGGQFSTFLIFLVLGRRILDSIQFTGFK